MSTQLSFQNWKNGRRGFSTGHLLIGKKNFGGKGLVGRRKSARPLSQQNVVHVVMKSSQARGSISLLRPRQARMVRQVLRLQSQKSKVIILDSVNLGTYLHLTLKIPHREAYTTFIRALSGLIARKALGAERGPALKKPRARRQSIFWDFRPLTQILDKEIFSFGVFHRMRSNPTLAQALTSELFALPEFSSA